MMQHGGRLKLGRGLLGIGLGLALAACQTVESTVDRTVETVTGRSSIPFGTPGMGLLMLPLGIGVCLLFAGSYRRWANLLIWASLAALLVGVLNSLRMSFMPTTLWQLGVYIVMIAAGGGLMFRGLNAYDANGQTLADKNDATRQQADDLRREIEALKARLDERNGER
jgi:hypothetical protein